MIEKILISTKGKSSAKPREVKTKIIKTSNSKFINKFGSTQSLMKEDLV